MVDWNKEVKLSDLIGRKPKSAQETIAPAPEELAEDDARTAPASFASPAPTPAAPVAVSPAPPRLSFPAPAAGAPGPAPPAPPRAAGAGAGTSDGCRARAPPRGRRRP